MFLKDVSFVHQGYIVKHYYNSKEPFSIWIYFKQYLSSHFWSIQFICAEYNSSVYVQLLLDLNLDAIAVQSEDVLV